MEPKRKAYKSMAKRRMRAKARQNEKHASSSMAKINKKLHIHSKSIKGTLFHHSYSSDQTEEIIEYTLWSNHWLSKTNILSVPHSPPPKAPQKP